MDSIEGFASIEIEWSCGKCDKVHSMHVSGEGKEYGAIATVEKMILDDIFPSVFGWDSGSKYDITSPLIHTLLAITLAEANE